MLELSQSTKELIAKYSLWSKSLRPKEGALTIHVDEVISKIAVFYEQIRTIIDWKEEHLMRRVAIIRKLKRRFLDLELNNFAIENIAEPLVMELIRGGYFPNDRIEETKIAAVQRVIEKYIFIIKHNPEHKTGKSGLHFYNRLLEIAACEIEETLALSLKEMALIDYMFSHMQEKIKISERIYEKELLKKEEKDVQIYIAVQQALFKLDSPIISYNLLKYAYPQWTDPEEEELLKLSQSIHKILGQIDQSLLHPLAKKFYAICEKYDTPYLLLGDILAKSDPQKMGEEIAEPAALEALVKNAYSKRLANLKAKINRSAIYSTVSIFITKVLSLILLEILLAKALGSDINNFSLMADVLIPTLLMAIMIITIRPPSKKNLNLAVIETMKIVYPQDRHEIYEIKLAPKRGVIMRAILSFSYLAGASISFGAIYLAFTYLRFPITSIVINLIFIALILFAGIAIRSRSRELTMEEESGGIFGFMSDMFFLPIAGLGRWLSNKWKKYNAITAFFNAMIDMPFSTFIEFLEGWRYFIKEKKEELR